MKYRVVYEPEDRGWNARIPAVRGCVTWGRSLEAARRHIREALATCVDVLGEDADRIARDAEFTEQFHLSGQAQAALSRYRKSKRSAERITSAHQAATSLAAAELTRKEHISLRDAGQLLGLSHERVSQIVRHQKRHATRASQPKPATRKPPSSRHA
ncbi:MAG: type II toxin-antitoxin system HicB family antitoxin [Myxococcota bacterium]|nr:type II toxin-antitoxin system HicB family antitoxin [Myxococcota bacterium]